MLEVLVAILVLSFGVLGAAGMQIAALQANKVARYQATAARLGAQYADLMRGNVAISTLTTSGNVFLLNLNGATGDPGYTDQCVASACSATQQAQFGIESWIRQLQDPQNGLPSARVVVCFDDTPFNASNQPQWACSASATTSRTYIKIGWQESTGTTNLDQQLSVALPRLILDVIQ